MGKPALTDVGYYASTGWTGKDGVNSDAEFLANHTAQDNAIKAYMGKQWDFITRNHLEAYEGQTLNGLKLTVSGMLGGEHLVGRIGLRNYLESGGDVVPSDGSNPPVAITRYISTQAQDVAKGIGGLATEFTANHAGNDVLAGGKGLDQFSGGAGNDTFTGKGGNDILDGGTGHDIAKYSGKCDEYTVKEVSAGKWTVSHTGGTKADGVDTLTNIEQLTFANHQAQLVNGKPFVCDLKQISFVIDTTTSMVEEINAVKSQAQQTINTVFGDGGSAEIAVSDIQEPGVEKTWLNFTTQESLADRKTAALNGINSLSLSGGGTDIPEGVYSGLKHALDGGIGEWKADADVRRIIMIGDAPPKDFSLADEVHQLAENTAGGVATASFASMSALAAAAAPVNVEIYTIAIGNDAQTISSFRTIADENNGRFFNAADSTQLVDALLQAINAPKTGETILGTAAADTIYGSAKSELIQSLAGNDSVYGNEGDDTIQAGDGHDVAWGWTGNDSMDGGIGNDTLGGDQGMDTVRGGEGNDIIYGGSENDSLYGDNGADMLLGDAGNDSLFGGAGNDTFYGGVGNDNLSGGTENDQLSGEDGNDILKGEAGNDRLFGGIGNDKFYGDVGVDTLEGGTGDDLFVFASASHSGIGAGLRDVITDFSQTDTDQIDLSAFAGTFGFIGTAAFDAIASTTQIHYLQTGGNTIVEVDSTGDGIKDFEIQLTGLITLKAADFVL